MNGTCSECKGYGKVLVNMAKGHVINCPTCGGTKKEKYCNLCNQPPPVNVPKLCECSKCGQWICARCRSYNYINCFDCEIERVLR